MDWTILHNAGYWVDVEMRKIYVGQRIPLRPGGMSDKRITIYYETFHLPDSIQNRAKQAFDLAMVHFVSNRLAS